MIAVMDNRNEIVTLLVSLGANMEIPFKNGETALVYAVHEKNPVIIKTLVQAGANVNHLDSTRENLLLRAVRAHRADVLRALLSHDTNDGVSTAFIDSAFKEAVMQPVRNIISDFPITYAGVMQSEVEELKQVNRIDMIQSLVPLVSDCRLFSNPEIFDKCVHLHELKDPPYCDFHVCHLLLRYGFAYGKRFFIPFIHKMVSHLSFARLLILASDNRLFLKYVIQGLLWTIRPNSRVDPVYRAMKFVVRVLSNPLTLQDLCVITARKRLRGRMWRKIDSLPLPPLLKDKLKLL